MKKKSPLSNQRYWVLIFSICLVLLTALPYLLAASQKGAQFTGFLIGVDDGNSYIAKMQTGAEGDWLFRSPYTAEEQRGALIYLPYILLGKLLGPGAQHAPLILLFHIYRSISIIVLCFAIYDFLSHFVADVKLRRLGLTLITLGSGLGWILLFIGVPNLLGSIPLDFYSPEAFGFLAIFSLPHLVLARALLLWGLLGYLHISEGAEKVRIFRIVLLWLALALVHLITAALGILLIAAHFGFVFIRNYLNKKKESGIYPHFQAVSWAMLGVAPVLASNAWTYWQDSYLRAWAAQNQILSPNPLHYLVAYGLLLPFAYIGLRTLLRNHWASASFLLTWLVLLPFMLYAPVGLQRRLSEGAWVMLNVLALCAFDGARKKGVQKVRDSRELWLFSLALPSTLILFLGSLQAAQNVQPPVFRPDAEVSAFDQLRQIAAVGDVVLTSYETGNVLPAWVPIRVVAGHGPESVGLERLLPRIQAIYQGRTTDDTRLEFFQRYRVDYVFWGPNEQRFGSWIPGEEDYLEKVIDVVGYEVYRVSEEAIQ